MKTNRRTVAAVAVAALALGIGTAAAAWSGTSDEPAEVPDVAAIQMEGVPQEGWPQQARLNVWDLECDGPLLSTLQNLRISDPGDDVPTVEDAEALMEELAATDDFPENAVVVSAGEERSAEPTPGQPVKFYGHDAEGRLNAIVDISSTSDGFVVDQYAACSPATIEEFPEDLQIRPLVPGSAEEGSR